MTDRWDSLRAKYQGKNTDLDAEFEKFLNESLSDESLASPRHKTPLKTKVSKETESGSLPWWAEEDEEGEKNKEALRQGWLKAKTKEDIDKENRDGNEKAEKLQTTQPIPVDTGMSQASNGNSTAVSISKDSLEEDDAVTGNSSVSPSHVMTPSKDAPSGVNTLQKEEDKLKFFQEQLRDDSQFDFYKELEEMSTTEFVSPDKERDHRLQATGAEVGDSIFNVSDNQTEEAKNSGDGDDDDAHDHKVDPDDDYSAQFEDTLENPDEEDILKDELYKSLQPTSESPDQKNPSLLSKVSLMDSLDSTLDRKRSKQTQFREKTKAMESTSISGSGSKATGTTDTITELQAALQQIQMNATDRSQQGSQPLDTQSGDQLVLEKTSSGETKSRGFSIRPSVIIDSRQAENDLKKRHLLTNIASAGITMSSNSIDSASLPVDCRGFSLKPSIPVLKRTDSQGIPLDSRVVPLDSQESQDSVTEKKRGLDLQPVANLLAIIEKEGRKTRKNDDDNNDENTPPPDSLRSIKAKVKAQKIVDATKSDIAKKQTSKKATKTASSPVRVRGSKGSLPLSSSGVPQKKGKRKEKENSNSIGKSRINQWQPSVSSAPSWSPTPNLRKSKHTEGKIPNTKTKTKSIHKEQGTDESSSHYVAESVESFANYLKHLVRPDENTDNQPPTTTRWCNDEPVKSPASIWAASADNHIEWISREQRLQSEVENWQTAWKDERRRNNNLITDFATCERELSRKEEKTRLDYEEQIHDLKQEIYSLQARLQEGQENAENRKKVASRGDLKVLSPWTHNLGIN